MTKWINTLEYKFRRFGIPNLMIYITVTMLAVYLTESLTRLPISRLLTLNTDRVMSGEVWRLITFIFVPPQNTLFWTLISLYFYYFIGNALENTWGSTRFTLFYLFGMIGAVIAALISGSSNNMYLNMSLFLAFAALYPEQQLLLFFILPIKVKYIAFVSLIVLAFSFVASGWTDRAAIIASLINLFIFFGDNFIDWLNNYRKYGKQRRNFRKSMKRQRDMYGN